MWHFLPRSGTQFFTVMMYASHVAKYCCFWCGFIVLRTREQKALATAWPGVVSAAAATTRKKN
jgi:uncharacterized protein YutD